MKVLADQTGPTIDPIVYYLPITRYSYLRLHTDRDTRYCGTITSPLRFSFSSGYRRVRQVSYPLFTFNVVIVTYNIIVATDLQRKVPTAAAVHERLSSRHLESPKSVLTSLRSCSPSSRWPNGFQGLSDHRGLSKGP